MYVKQEHKYKNNFNYSISLNGNKLHKFVVQFTLPNRFLTSFVNARNMSIVTAPDGVADTVETLGEGELRPFASGLVGVVVVKSWLTLEPNEEDNFIRFVMGEDL
jgi:hypothetical protein